MESNVTGIDIIPRPVNAIPMNPAIQYDNNIKTPIKLKIKK